MIRLCPARRWTVGSVASSAAAEGRCDDFVLTSWFSDLTGGSASGVSRCSAFTGPSDLRRRSDNVRVSLCGFYPLSVSFVASMLLSRLGPCGLSRTLLCRASLLLCLADIRQRNEEVCSSFRLLSSPFHSPLCPLYIVLVPSLVERLAALAPSPCRTPDIRRNPLISDSFPRLCQSSSPRHPPTLLSAPKFPSSSPYPTSPS